jgi:transcriptional regulator with XRE-family HTH domain
VSNPNPLSDALRSLRKGAGLSGVEAARRAHLSQSKVSRAETGSFLLSEDELRGLCRVYDAPAEVVGDLVRMTIELREDSTAARVVLQRGGWWMQQRIGRIEAEAQMIRSFTPAVVIGLLQTRDYIDALLGQSLEPEDRERMILARIERQRVLDTTRRFVFVMAEGALRWNMGGAALMADQLDKMIAESRRPNVRLGVIPWTTPAHVPALHGFTIYDSRAVLLGTQTATAIITDDQNVEDYEAHWAELLPPTSWGDDARDVIGAVAADYRSLI